MTEKDKNSDFTEYRSEAPEADTKADTASHKEAIQRFCPVQKKNVVMLRHYEGIGERFECISDSCNGGPDCKIKA